MSALDWVDMAYALAGAFVRRWPKLDRDDAKGEAALALMEALAAYDASKGAPPPWRRTSSRGFGGPSSYGESDAGAWEAAAA